jgi:hypothetical protein
MSVRNDQWSQPWNRGGCHAADTHSATHGSSTSTLPKRVASTKSMLAAPRLSWIGMASR